MSQISRMFYWIMIQTYLAERALIHPGKLVEVKYEDLEAQPLNAVRQVYQRLDLPGFAEAEVAFMGALCVGMMEMLDAVAATAAA